MKAINLKLPEELYERVKKIAEKKGQTVSALIRLATAEYCEKEEKK